jgi:hypothetical protein
MRTVTTENDLGDTLFWSLAWTYIGHEHTSKARGTRIRMSRLFIDVIDDIDGSLCGRLSSTTVCAAVEYSRGSLRSSTAVLEYNPDSVRVQS